MSKRAEQSALSAYPNETGVKGLICEQSRGIFIKGYEQAEKDLIPLINRLCEAILFDWDNKAELAREIQSKIKEE